MKIQDNTGLTLIEILLVFAITSILMAVIWISVGNQRKNARAAAALSTAKSVLPYANECYFRHSQISLSVPGQLVCLEAKAEWPAITSAGCNYDTTLIRNALTPDDYVVVCEGKRIVCGVAADNSGCQMIDLP